jgi:hypothetical protein
MIAAAQEPILDHLPGLRAWRMAADAAGYPGKISPAADKIVGRNRRRLGKYQRHCRGGRYAERCKKQGIALVNCL